MGRKTGSSRTMVKTAAGRGEGALPEGAREREKVFKEWRQTHGAAL